VAEEKMAGTDTEKILDFFENPPVTNDYSLEWGPPDEDAITGMLCDDFDFSPERVRRSLEGLKVTGRQKTLDSWF
jgi:flap endonuclease-1